MGIKEDIDIRWDTKKGATVHATVFSNQKPISWVPIGFLVDCYQKMCFFVVVTRCELKVLLLPRSPMHREKNKSSCVC